MKQELTSSKIFSAIAVFDLLREQLYLGMIEFTMHYSYSDLSSLVFWELPLMIQSKVSLDRMNEFLNEVCGYLFLSSLSFIDLFIRLNS